jgi:hypothetical protein
VTELQWKPPRRPQAAILLPVAGSAGYATALGLARQVARSGWEITAIEPRPARTAALDDLGRERGIHRFALDVPVDGQAAVFGCTPAERLVAQFLVDRRIDVVHAHLAGELVLVPLLERAWLLGIPLVVTVHGGWPPSTFPCGVADRSGRAALARRLVRDVVGLASLLCAPDAHGAADTDAWTEVAPLVVDHTGAKAGRGWADLYRLLAGDPEPPGTGLTLSVIVTTYQRHSALRGCLEALVDQTLPSDRFEVIVVDDASQPSAGPVVEAFGDRLDVTFVRLDRNVGLGRARNAGVEASRGDVLFFLDDDDEPAPRCLAEHVRSHAERGDEVQAVLGWTGPTADRSVSVDAWVAFRAGLYISYPMPHLRVLDWFGFWGGRSSIRRDFLGDERFELAYLEDADLGYRLSRHGFQVVHNRHAVQRVRIGLDAASLLRRSSRFGQARANMAHRHPRVQERSTFAPDRYAATLSAQLPHRGTARLRTLTVAATTLEALRATPDPYGAGSQLDRLVADLSTVAGAEGALGWALGRRRIAAREAGRPLRIGVSALSPLLGELVRLLRATPRASAALVVGAPPGMSRAQLDAALAAAGADAGPLTVERLVCDRATELWQVCDVVATVNLPEGHDPVRHALPLPRGTLGESLQRLVHTRDLVGSFR